MITDAEDEGISMGDNSDVTGEDEVVQIWVIKNLMEVGKGWDNFDRFFSWDKRL